MIKTDELRNLESEELAQRLKDSRRELFELRFKHAVGQLENHRQILQVRKDIARILTVIHEHRLGMTHEHTATPENVEEVEASSPLDGEVAAKPPEGPQKKTGRKKAAETQEETQ